jgi:uncharacterized protein (DUF4213/DUF364 family)
MTILGEAAQLVKEGLGHDFERLTIERIVVGLFFTGIKLSNGVGGICFTPIKEIPEAVCCPSSAGRAFDPQAVRGMKAADALSALNSNEPIKTAVSIATLNAMSATCWERGLRGNYIIRMNMDAQEALNLHKDSPVAVVGAILPILRTLKNRGGPWWVVEEDPRTLKSDEIAHFVPAHKSNKVISDAEVLIITGVTLVNHTIEGILKMARPGAEIAVIGPTASILPEPLFERGVRVVGGVWVKRADELLEVLAAGGSGYHFLDTLADKIVMEKTS